MMRNTRNFFKNTGKFLNRNEQLLNKGKLFGNVCINFCTKSTNVNINKNNEKYDDFVKFFFDLNIKTKKLPCFEVYSSQIEILSEPIDYYLAILKLIRSTKERICISSLYLGTGKMEEFLVDEIIKALKRHPNLKVNILLDKGRGTREVGNKSSALLLKKVLTEVRTF